MKIRNLSNLGVLALAVCSLNVMAAGGPNVVVGTGSGIVASTTPVVIPVSYAGDGTVVGFEFEVTYDSTNLSANLSSCGGPLGGATALCSEAVMGTIKFLAFDQSFTPLPDGSIGSVSFDISTAPINAVGYALTVENELYGDAQEGSVPSTGSTNGLVRVVDGPQAAYSDALSPNPLALAAAEEGDANPMGTVTVTNTGDPSTTLTGTCSYSGDTAMSLSSGAFSLAQNASKVVTLTCNSSAEGSYSGTVSCAHNANNTPSPVEHDATCVVGPPGDAKYTSVPTPGTPVNLTDPGSPAIVGSVIPDQELVITNNPLEANDSDLALINCGLTGGASAISATAVTTPLAPFASTTVTFSCDSSVVGDYSDTYSCSYDENGDATPDGTATYAVNCSVRNPESEVVESPISGTPLTIVVPIGGTGQALVTFNEILGEGADGTLDDCSFDDVTYHRIVTPTSFPQVIPSDGSVVVAVEGMGTDDGLPTTATLTCSYTDSDNEATPVSWRVDVYVQALEIPTLSAWGLALMMLILLGLGGFVIRRQALS